MIDLFKKQQDGFLIIDWKGRKSPANESQKEKYTVAKSLLQLGDLNNMPVNGRLINGKAIYMEVECHAVDHFVTGVYMDINATRKKLAHFGSFGSTIEFTGYERNDDWEVIAHLNYMDSVTMLNTSITVLDKSSSTITLSVAGEFDEPAIIDGKEVTSTFYFQNEFELKDFNS